jgi:uncharacterized protein involved in tolerance to divalent cations
MRSYATPAIMVLLVDGVEPDHQRWIVDETGRNAVP